MTFLLFVVNGDSTMSKSGIYDVIDKVSNHLGPEFKKKGGNDYGKCSF